MYEILFAHLKRYGLPFENHRFKAFVTWSLLLGVAWRVVAVRVQRLRPLLAGRVTGLVGVPGLFAVVAKLGATAIAPAHQPGAAGTAGSDDGEPGDQKKQKLNVGGDQH